MRYSSRIALKMLFTQFGEACVFELHIMMSWLDMAREVTACWIPPLEHRSNERACSVMAQQDESLGRYVKFGTTKAAQAAFEASQAGQLFLAGPLIYC